MTDQQAQYENRTNILLSKFEEQMTLILIKLSPSSSSQISPVRHTETHVPTQKKNDDSLKQSLLNQKIPERLRKP